ncbi:BON domain-containing protein [Couchioplanes caeruleus]|uniref:BON domain-containing protein n=1 Tax=Couchioplanes caeruleus TaxID=56438 RepID=UPI0020C148C2|nr:BON domain-containing protein [Couchioplanes caeruleus]UQU62701.1 BON domain-containing protein [Couchioplanes caeruleus]
MTCQADVATRDGTAGTGAPRGRAAGISREVAGVLRRRLWIHPEQVQAHTIGGTVVLTGDVGRRSTAAIAGRLAAAVPGVTAVVDDLRYEFDDTELVRSKVHRTHPFSADPFPPGHRSGPRRRRFFADRRQRAGA